MDEKTEELRDLFVETTGEDTVTERQQEGPGDLADSAEEDPEADERLATLVAEMRERFDFRSRLDDEALIAVVRGFFRGDDDGALAERLEADEATVFQARMDLHLVRERDREAPIDLAALRRLLVDGEDVEAAAESLDADPETVAHYAAVVRADRRSTRVNHRFRDEFGELLTDQDLENRHAQDAHEDGLREAAEDIETNVSF